MGEYVGAGQEPSSISHHDIHCLGPGGAVRAEVTNGDPEHGQSYAKHEKDALPEEQSLSPTTEMLVRRLHNGQINPTELTGKEADLFEFWYSYKRNSVLSGPFIYNGMREGAGGVYSRRP